MRRRRALWCVQRAELDAQQRGLQLVEARVVADLVVVVLDARAIVAQHPQPFGERRVVGGHGAAVAERAEVLARIEAPRHGVDHARPAGGPCSARRGPARASSSTFRPWRRAMSSSGSMSAGWPYRCTGSSARVRDVIAASTRAGSRLQRGLVGLDRDRGGADVRHRQPGGDVGVGRHDDFVAGADVRAHAAPASARPGRWRRRRIPGRRSRPRIPARTASARCRGCTSPNRAHVRTRLSVRWPGTAEWTSGRGMESRGACGVSETAARIKPAQRSPRAARYCS